VIPLCAYTDKYLNYRVGGGFWRRGGETPSAVKWEDRIIEIREGSWSYVAGSIGRAPGMFLYKCDIN
jgi:hypothetical protein